MKVFIWDRIDKVSDAYHEEGGLVVFANSEHDARLIANKTDGVNLKDDEAPTKICDVAEDVEESVHTFPDAGCC